MSAWLTRLFGDGQAFNHARWVLLSDWSGWAWAGALLLCAVIWALANHNLRARPSRQRRILLGLRGLTLLVFLTLLAQPGVRLEDVTRERNHLALLLDASRSMSLPAEGGLSRIEALKAALSPQQMAMWAQDHVIDLYAVSERAQPIGALADLHAEGGASDLLRALEDVATRRRAGALAGIVLISDGADTSARGAALTRAEAATLGRLEAPLHTLYVGPKTPIPDLGIEAVHHDDFAFVRNAVSVSVDIRVDGLSGVQRAVTLSSQGRRLARRLLRAERPGVKRVDFEFVPDEQGKAIFEVHVEPFVGERVLENNTRRFVMRVIRDKIRVLQVVGRPSWDQRSLRKLLKKNPNVDLISFFILRTNASLNVTRKEELSLIPFPTQELFEVQLGSFDLIIFQNFTYRGYHMRRYLPMIRDYIRGGGGFVMIGGDQSFASGGYAGTPLAECLPFALKAQADYVEEGPFQARLTHAGLRHPITALHLIPEENRALWAALPALEGFNAPQSLRGGAVLLDHPSAQVDGAPTPILTAADCGAGRVLALSSGTTWYWDLVATGEGGDNRAYYKLWGNAIRWLIRDPALRPVQVEADRDRYPLGAEATFTVRALNHDYQPALDAPVRLSLYREGGASPWRQIEGRTDARGEALLRHPLPEGGGFRVEALVETASGALRDADHFVVSTDPLELQTPANPARLAAMAEAAEGEAREAEAGLGGLSLSAPQILRVNRRQDTPLWAAWWVFILALLPPSFEWYLRRRWSLL